MDLPLIKVRVCLNQCEVVSKLIVIDLEFHHLICLTFHKQHTLESVCNNFLAVCRVIQRMKEQFLCCSNIRQCHLLPM